MANQWFRMYAEFAHDPKVQMMSEADQRRFIMLLCLRCSNGDVTLHETLSDDEVAFQLRISADEWHRSKALFLSKGLISEDNNPTAWDRRQYASDSSAARVAAFRERKKQGLKQACNVTVTPPDTDTDTDTEEKEKQEKEKSMRHGVPRSDRKNGKAEPKTAPHSATVSHSAPKFDPTRFIPEHLSIDLALWRAYVQLRAKLKKPITSVEACQGIAAKLRRFESAREGGANQALANSIERSWIGLFPPKDDDTSYRDAQAINEVSALFRGHA